MQTSQPMPIYIHRHIIQLIWQYALTNPANTLGLLGSQSISQVSHSHHGLNQMQTVISHWQKQHIACCGVFQHQKMSLEHMIFTESKLQQYITTDIAAPFIHLYTNFDTKGCLKSTAWILQQQQPIELALELIEDGQQAIKD